MSEAVTAPELGVTLTMTHFSPSEAERITETPLHLQRVWRSRGYLPSHDGHARYDLPALSEMLSLKLIADRTGPLLARHIATVCGQGIAWRVLGSVDAYEGDYLRIGEWDAEAFSRRQRVIERVREASERMPAGGAAWFWEQQAAICREEGGPGFDQLGWLRHHVLRARGIEVMPARFLVWFADGKHEWCNKLDAAFDNRGSWDPRFAGAVLVLDLDALAMVIQERAGRAFVCVEMPIDGLLVEAGIGEASNG